jgi:glycosyltransferase involved in cell wall biosynthesis
MFHPFVSVIMPVYNRASSVRRAVESVLAQSYEPFELIVVDDGSTDRTHAILEQFGSSIRMIDQPHSGAYVARNFGSRYARGELLAFADSDDAWLPDLLESEVPLMQRPEVGLVFGDAIHVTAATADAPRTGQTCFRVSPPRRGAVVGQLAWNNFVPTCTALVRRSYFEAVGGFPETSEVSADMLLWFRIAARHEVDYVDRVVAEYTVHSEGISHELGRAIDARIRLFSNELQQTTDPALRALLERLLFNLSMSLALAAIRGRARTAGQPVRRSLRTALSTGRASTPLWMADFAIHQVRNRARRIFQ